MNVASGPASLRTKLEAARTRLVLDKPFLGALLLHLPLQSSTRCPSVATDGRRLYFNPSFIASLELGHVQFMLAHQALHCALGHLWRRGTRTRSRWDLACDYAVNVLLADDGMSVPPRALLDLRYRGLAAEEIYPLLPQEDAAGLTPIDQHLFDSALEGASRVAATAQDRRSASGHDAHPVAMSDDAQWDDAASHARRSPGEGVLREGFDADEIARRWQMRLALAGQQASRAGRLGASWQRVLGRLLQPALPWQSLLARFLMTRTQEDYSFQRPGRREGDAVLPRLHSAQLELFVVLDTSGSIGDSQLEAFASELEALKGQVRARVTLHACDAMLAGGGPWVFEPWEPMRLPASLSGGGGSDFRPAFDWIRSAHLRPDVLIYFTDAEGEFPDAVPPFPVLWLVKGPASVPWGERIQLN